MQFPAQSLRFMGSRVYCYAQCSLEITEEIQIAIGGDCSDRRQSITKVSVLFFDQQAITIITAT
jgi:hypothetical protein